METTITSPIDNNPHRLKQEILNRISVFESQGSHTAEIVARIKKEYRHILDPEIPLETQQWLKRFITVDEQLIEIKKQAGLLADHKDTVLISGPTGTGKELIARALHGDKERDKFFALNCAGFTAETLMESELFGHVKGSFTGADRTTDGVFRLANEGTLFLDEVGELPLNIQAKLLRVIQERVVKRVGGDKYEPVTCRIVCATLKDLEKMVEGYRFREDLYWRINTFHLKLSPLIERVDDIPHITKYVSEQLETELKVKPEHRYPIDKYHISPNKLSGNVRSIQQIVRRYHLFQKIEN